MSPSRTRARPGSRWSPYVHYLCERQYWLLAWHPGAFVGAAIVWLPTWLAFVQSLPVRLSIASTFLFTLGHAFGVATWLLEEGVPGLVAAIALFVVAKYLIAWFWSYCGADKILQET